ncbi:hypothetical protein [Rhodophyticola porphyridii]|uniref:hypothetical protein n=1 Tax=Rhodophyticola porphyridii TaxID=1852017 RepID=UPI0018F42394|nr:hypothetical protein [Rhodophyticola porphyridii]
MAYSVSQGVRDSVRSLSMRLSILGLCAVIGGVLADDLKAQTLLSNPDEGKNVAGGTGPLAPRPAPPPTEPAVGTTDPKGGPAPAPVPLPVPAPQPEPPQPAPAPETPQEAGTTPPEETADTGTETPEAGALAPEESSGPAPAVGADIPATLAVLAAGFPEGEAESFTQMLIGLPDGVSADTIGHLLYPRRQFDRAAWFFGVAAQRPGASAASLNNFGVLAMEVYADAPDAWPETMLQAAHDALVAANAVQPDEPAILTNLGNAARRLGLHDAAAEHGGRATELAPEEPLYWTNLARSLAAAGDADGAAAALARAHLLEPNGLALLETLPALPGAAPGYSRALQTQCDVNFRCQEICPRSIIGGLMSVTYEIENSSAQIACTEGRPYPTSYRCEEDLPEYGILIPGLNSGFSVAVPGFSAHVLVQGDGSVDVRVEAGASIGPVGGYLRADGHYDPSGGVSFDNPGGGVRVNLLPNSPANQLASDLGHPPVHIEAETLNGGPVQINGEAYNAGLLSF